jgi:hypothetical protein
LPSGLTAIAKTSRRLSAIRAQSGVALSSSSMQPAGASAPVVVLRSKVTSASSPKEVVKTDFPSELTATATGSSSPSASWAQASTPLSVSSTQPIGVSAPLAGLRLSSAIASSSREIA